MFIYLKKKKIKLQPTIINIKTMPICLIFIKLYLNTMHK